MTIRVVMADDQELLRAGFRVLLAATEDLELVGEAGTGREAVTLTRRLRPDVVLMDVRMPDMDGIEATRHICAAQGPTLAPAASAPAPGSVPPPTNEPKVLILTTFDLDAYVYGALRAGASGFLLKDTPPAELLAAVRVVADGDALLAPGVTRRLIAEFARRPEPTASVDADGLRDVTDREREVLTLIARGLSNAEIAGHLHLSPATVKTHITRLLSKLSARDRAQLVIAAYESGLVAPYSR